MQSANQPTLLIVEDDEYLRAMLSEALTSVGYTTLVAGDGQEALDIVASRPVDCVISDIKMPNVDGLTLLSRLKASNKSLPVVMITGWAYRDHKEAASRAGADGFLMKPFRLGRIEEILAQVLPRDGAESAKHRIRSILIVEDNMEFRLMLSDLTTAMGYKVRSVPTGEDALSAISHDVPDAIIVDYQLPGISGGELIIRIKEQHPDLPVLLMTGSAISTDGRDLANGQADAFLIKPFRVDRIGDLLKSLENPAP
ncbi:MAG TPA: response regulator [candidate division Zixibacteria bacterium]|jgi:CheY-like chemotaxis protein